MTAPLLVRLGARDRALMLRCAMSPRAPRVSRIGWAAVTHLGGTGPSLAAAGLPWLGCCELRQAGELALATLVVSHLLVQLVKRTVGRGRPAGACRLSATVREPDRFSFPSGHATASLAVALSYAAVFPAWAGPLLLLALLAGFSRVRLAVHYPSDVLAGQVIALGAAAALWAAR
ncbi:MAG TPA: phosphatase PAP2 family protein [Gemmatimonadales bacterium]|nr:phosphatase PAP2 family protein [Gemmatimonadales bacterium]